MWMHIFNGEWPSDSWPGGREFPIACESIASLKLKGSSEQQLNWTLRRVAHIVILEWRSLTLGKWLQPRNTFIFPSRWDISRAASINSFHFRQFRADMRMLNR